MQADELNQLVNDFRLYKGSHLLPATFGRDVFYDHLNTLNILKIEEVKHIHLASQETPWKPKTEQYNKTSDHHLVYCQGTSNPMNYLLMAILRPDAHQQSRNRNIMYNLGTMAEQFRLKF
ncbi:MAG: mRNA interferase toxin YafO [Candidatus Celerinatantimonas neptuna]|nr:MAG: mRNA interferase toxin YafO [Candidatus Celerinatantimonas neptuna]